MSPYVLAIFIICTPDLLQCRYLDSWSRSFEMDTDACWKYVAEMTVEQGILGKCVWRIRDD